MTTFSVPNMSCGHCKAKIEDALLDADEGAMIEFDMDNREVSVDSSMDAAAIAQTIQSAGYEATAKG
jgi:copper chaperone